MTWICVTLIGPFPPSVFFPKSGALTKGDRRAATGVEFEEFNFDTQYGRAALRHMYNAVVKVRSNWNGEKDNQCMCALRANCLLESSLRK